MANQARATRPTNEDAQKRQIAKPVPQERATLAWQADSGILQRAVANLSLARPADILGFQGTAGNRAVTRLIQAKHVSGLTGDRQGQKTGRVAGDVLRLSERYLQCQTEPGREEEVAEAASTEPQVAAGEDSPSIFEGEEARLEDIEDQTSFFSPAPASHDETVKLGVSYGGQAPVGTLQYGVTIFNKKFVTIPNVDIDWQPQGKAWTGVVKPTKAELKDVPSLYLQPGTYEVPGKKVHASYPQCGAGGKQVTMFSQVDDKMSELIKTGEQEHCSDYERAFELSLKKCADLINAIAGAKFGPDTRPNIEQQILKKIGGKTPKQWVQELNRLVRISVDERDKKGWHRLKPDGAPVTCSPDCSKLTGVTVKSPSTKVPGPASANLIK